MAPLVITACHGVKLFINDAALARDIVTVFLTRNSAGIMSKPKMQGDFPSEHDDFRSVLSEGAGCVSEARCFSGSTVAIEHDPVTSGAGCISGSMATFGSVDDLKTQHVSGNHSVIGQVPHFEAAGVGCISGSLVDSGSYEGGKEKLVSGDVVKKEDIADATVAGCFSGHSADNIPERGSDVKTAAVPLHSCVVENLSPFLHDPEVPSSVKKGLGALFDRVASLDEKLTHAPPLGMSADKISKNVVNETSNALGSDGNPADMFYASLLRENPKSRLATEYFKKRNR